MPSQRAQQGPFCYWGIVVENAGQVDVDIGLVYPSKMQVIVKVYIVTGN